MSRLGRYVVAWGVVAFSLAVPSSAGEEAPKQAEEVRVENIQVRLSDAGPVVLLRVGSKAVPIFVDALVAQGIQNALVGEKSPRPLTHDLMKTILEALDAKVSRVLITEKGSTFYGALTVVAGNAPRVFDSRSSDAIALAIHFKAPILLEPRLVDAFGVELPEPRGKQL